MKKLFITLALFVLSSCSTISTVSEFYSPVTEPEQTAQAVSYEKYSLYEVTSNDTLASVARKHSLFPAQIIKINNLQSPYSLHPGSVIKIPTPLSDSPIAESNQSSNKKGVIIKPKHPK